MTKVLLEILQNSPENTLCVRVSFLIKLQAFFHRTPLVALPEYFASINKNFILARKLGTSLSFSMIDSGRVPVFKTTG